MTSNNNNDKKGGDGKEVVRVPLSPMENLAVGSFSGALETSIQMPILTYKLCLQEGRPLPQTMKGWFRGVAVQAGTVAPITAIQFAVNGLLQSMVRGNEDPNRKLNDIEIIGTAAGAGALSALVYSPVDLITIQQQKLAKNPVDTLRHLFKEYGPQGIMRGLFSCALRESVYTAGYLGLSPVVTAHLQQTTTFSNSPLASKITGACLAGIMAAIVTHPVDTAKTVIQADIGVKVHPNSRTAFMHLLNTEGVSSLYRGFVPRTVRICGAFFACTTIQDQAIKLKSEMVGKGTW